jgi:arylformamidase
MTIREDMQTFNNVRENSPAIRCIQDHSAGGVYESEIKLNVHTGTHVDAPLHMLEGGATIESIPLERLVGPARVLDLQHVGDAVRASDLEPFAIQPGEWILLKTRSSFSDSFDFGFPFLTEDGAKFLVNKGINGVGIDALGIERSQDGFPTHKLLFRHGIIILEGLRLGEVPAGTYWMVVAPLKLEKTEAAPARAFLIGT